jgi:2-methylfumaryl-CoA isomerase
MNSDSTTAQPLQGLRIIEHASFVAGPSGGMTLAQLGADVIRVDPLGGAADYSRWPLSQRSGESLFWSSLNRGKRAVSLDTRSDKGRELLVALVTAPGEGGGILVDNNPRAPWLQHDVLTRHRPDTIKVHIEGYADGRGAVDYTVNPEVGIPSITGPEQSAPTNHALPAWDLIAGATATTGLLAALRHRDRTGEGTDLHLALADVALSAIANMGWFTEADELGHDRERVGNYLYGAYGVDFATADGARVMVVALTRRQWQSLCATTGTSEVFTALADSLGIDWDDEGARFVHREMITAILRPWFSARPFADVSEALDAGRVLWSKYRTISETLSVVRDAEGESVLTDIDQPGIGPVVAARSPLRPQSHYGVAREAPVLAQHTEEVLTDVLGLSGAEIGRLHDAGVIALATCSRTS